MQHAVERYGKLYGQVFSSAEMAIGWMTKNGWTRDVTIDNVPLERLFFHKKVADGRYLTAEVVPVKHPVLFSLGMLELERSELATSA